MVAPGLRVIAGSARGRRLVVPRGDAVRPTKDRVKAAVFSALDARGLIEGAVVLDLYAGSAALAIESLSRGAARATAVERHAGALEAIALNRAVLDDPAELVIVAGDAVAFTAAATATFDLAFFDPPYEMSNAEVARRLASVTRIVPGGTIVIERPARPQLDDLAEMPLPSEWRESWRRSFGDTLVVFWSAS